MKTHYLTAALVLGVFSLPVLAANTEAVAVYATQQNQGSVAIGNQVFYTRDFTVSVANLSDKNVDLSKLCLQASSADGKVFKLDTVDEKLTSGFLKPKAMVKGLAVFASSDESVYKATLVKISDKCQ
ncbi:DUF4354 family protein [Serratia sp. L9]|uniref:DUF4354 family protein n=1 Tax=Serratia sp. L9 TaxID=3423946 RepID=UPI003D67ED03